MCPKNPHTFLLAGMSHATQDKAALILTGLSLKAMLLLGEHHPTISPISGVKYEVLALQALESLLKELYSFDDTECA